MTNLDNCRLCPRECGANRNNNEKGLCGAGKNIKVAKAFLHQWEEPCISSGTGSGTIFFSGCNMGCIFCQNYKISHEGFGIEITPRRLSEICLELQSQGAANINLVSPTPYALHITEAITLAKDAGLSIPVIYNTNGYEKPETIGLLSGTADIYLPDIKYFSNVYGLRYSKVKDYFKYASEAVRAMIRQAGLPKFDDHDNLRSGVLIRHLLLPGLLEDSKLVLNWIAENFGADAYVSLMCQYTPVYNALTCPEIDQKVSEADYEALIDYFFEIGLENGFVQEYESATTDFIPDFDLSGL